jgi:hypothetical protein
MVTSNAGYATRCQGRFTRSGAVRPLRSVRLARCRRFGPSPGPTHDGGRWATMPSADFGPVPPSVAARRAARVAVGSGGVSSPFGLARGPAPLATTAPSSSMACPALSDWASVRLPERHGPPAGPISPDKDMNFPCTTAALTRSPALGGLRHLVLTRPGTEPSMRFLSVGSHVCARASSRQTLTGLPLPSASSYYPHCGHRYSYRGLSPHKFTPVLGVHNRMHLTGYSGLRPPPPAGNAGR